LLVSLGHLLSLTQRYSLMSSGAHRAAVRLPPVPILPSSANGSANLVSLPV